MTTNQIVWDQSGSRLYETGVQKGVLYPQVDGEYPKGVAWNGLTAVTESPSGAEATPMYADNVKYLNLIGVEEFGATVEAFTYPDEFAKCDGSEEVAPGVLIGQQTRQPFGLCYRTELGNDELADGFGYKLHLVYGAIAAPSEKAYQTINDTPEAITFSTGYKPTASLTIDSTKVTAEKLKALETVLYGTAAVTEPSSPAVDARLPLPDEILTILAA